MVDHPINSLQHTHANRVLEGLHDAYIEWRYLHDRCGILVDTIERLTTACHQARCALNGDLPKDYAIELIDSVLEISERVMK